METLEHVGWLLQQVLDFLAYFWPISLPLAGVAILSLVIGYGWKQPQLARVGLRLVVLAAAAVGLFLVISVVFAREAAVTYPPAVAWPAHLATAVLLAHVAGALILVAGASPHRMRLLPVLAATLWLSVCAWIVAFLSVSGAGSL